MIDFNNRRLFTPFTHPESGITFHIETGEVRHFPETQFSAESPHVDSASGDVFWCEGPSVWRR